MRSESGFTSDQTAPVTPKYIPHRVLISFQFQMRFSYNLFLFYLWH